MENKKRPKKIIGAVCLSVSQKFNLPVMLLRLVLVVVSFFFFWVIVPLYVILWIVQPFKSKQMPLYNDDLKGIDANLLPKQTETPSSVLTIMLFIGLIGFVGPFGVIATVFVLGDDAFSGSFNSRSLIDSFFLIFYVKSTSYNFLLAIFLSIIAWIVKKKQISFMKVFELLAASHIVFAPFLLFTLLFTIVPIEGNIMGFIVFPVFILASLLGYIIFAFFFARKLKKHDSQSYSSSNTFLFRTFAIASLLIIGVNLNIKESSKSVEIISFQHEDFSWGINKIATSRGDAIFEKNSDPKYAYIRFNGSSVEDTNSITLANSHYSMYTEMETVIPINHYILQCLRNIEDSSWPNMFSQDEITAIINNKKDTIYRLPRHLPAQSIFLDSTILDKSIFNTIVGDLTEYNSGPYPYETNRELIYLEAVALGRDPSKIPRVYENDANVQIIIDSLGNVIDKKYENDWNYTNNVLGYIQENQFIISESNMDLWWTDYNDLDIRDYSTYKNTDGKSILDLYKSVDRIECSTNIDSAVKNCKDLFTLNLINQENKGVPSSIDQLSNLRTLFARNVSVGVLPESFCSLENLHSITFINIDSVVFPLCIGKMRLEFVTLNNCNLNKFPTSLLNVKTLIELDITGNRIFKIPGKTGLSRLKMDYQKALQLPQTIIEDSSFLLTLVTYSSSDTKKAQNLLNNTGRFYVVEGSEEDLNNSYEGVIWYIEQREDSRN